MKFKNKNTGEIVNNYCTSWGSDGTFYYIIDSKGVKSKCKEDTFKKTYEPVHINIKDYIDKLEPLHDLSREFDYFLDVVARRNTPGGYFHIGDLVYFISTDYLCNGSIRSEEVHNHLNGPENPYTIIDIRKDIDSPRIYYIYLSYGVKTGVTNPDVTIKIPYYIDMYDSRDAFFVLSRYDMPY